MKLWIVSTLDQSPGTDRFVAAAQRRGHDVRRVHPQHMAVHMGGQAPFEFWEHGDRLDSPDGIFTRMGAAAPLRAFVLLRAALQLSVPVVNHPDGLTSARNKVLTAQILAARSIPTPETLAIGVRFRPEDLGKVLGPSPWVLKEAVGSKGSSVHLIHDEEELRRRLEGQAVPEGGWLLQHFVREAAGSDVRVLVVGGRALAAMKRTGKPGDFRSNLHQGGHGAPFPLDDDLARLAEAATEALGLEVAGVDVLETDSGYQVLEVNGSPGLAGISDALGRDLSEELVAYLEARWQGPC